MKNTSSGKNGRRFFGPTPQVRSSSTRDEDLVLFRELHKREKDRITSLLIPVSEEFELTGSANNHNQAALFRIPSNKRNSSGLQSLFGADKNDYDWLKTPPATPLFPSLDMEAATAPEMAVQKELPIMQPVSKFSWSCQQAPKLRQKQAYPNPKIPSNNKPKTSPTPIATNFTTKKPHKTTANHVTPRHVDQCIKTNISKPDPKHESSFKPKSRVGTDPRLFSVAKSRIECGTTETTSLRTPRMNMTTTTTNLSSFIGSKMVDKMMSARKGGGGDEVVKTVERVGGFSRAMPAATLSSLYMSVKPTKETTGGLRRSSKTSTGAKLSIINYP